MATQALKTILAALVSQLDTDVGALNYVTDNAVEIDRIAPGKFPAAIITVGPSHISHAITSTNWITVLLNIRLATKSGQSELYDIWEAVLDSIADDPSIGGTCIKALVATSDPPVVWPKGELFFGDCQVEVVYERDF